jgi:hypothetical protein
MPIRGIFGQPYAALDGLLDLGALAEVHDEICLALTHVPTGYTGGSHRSMGIVPPSLAATALVDYGEVIRAMGPVEFETFRALSDEPAAIDPAAREALEFGEERAIPLSRRQMLWLEVRHGVYFPWKAYVELIPNRTWGEKTDAAGKDFTRLARTFFPKTIAFVKSLPFVSIGRCNVMGLAAHDHGTVHRDGEPADQAEDGADPFITFCPAGNKRLFLWDEEHRKKTYVEGRAYWFNDHDYHGVDADPFFRYSVRVDGRMTPEFVSEVRAAARATKSP